MTAPAHAHMADQDDLMAELGHMQEELELQRAAFDVEKRVRCAGRVGSCDFKKQVLAFEKVSRKLRW